MSFCATETVARLALHLDQRIVDKTVKLLFQFSEH